ncbi:MULTISPECIES: formimidoylglutamase [Rufibacter]|uniref:Arginase family enzyme n=1 Tax=Rufibacter quisquiliarum TaxID=1549639 RepID=A0A839GS18_9BACT|nr:MULTISPECIES: formimidoylglutamase [Rufibacter]MBA9077626.1 arginase family enzyme [Rufibacter quisquiliarum]
MNLSIFFEPLPEDTFGIADNPKSVGGYLAPFIHTFPDWRSAEVVLVGLPEYRGTTGTVDLTYQGPNLIRQQLYRLMKGTGSWLVMDLGNLLPGIELEDTYLRLKEVVEILVDAGKLPLLLGGSHDLTYGQFLGYEHLHKTASLALFDSQLDLLENEDATPEQSHLHRILLHDPNYLFSLSHLGHQTYLTDNHTLAALEKLHFELYRIGQVRQNLKEIEPVIRQADLVSFDVSAIRHQDAPGQLQANPFGFTGEEACQLAWYAGQSEQLTSFGLYGYRPEHDHRHLTATTLATMVWYVIEGYYQRQQPLNFQSNQFMRFSVGFHDNPNKMIFYKNRQNDKWWMEVEDFSGLRPPLIIPCSYQDYLTAADGEVPNRWILTQSRM